MTTFLDDADVVDESAIERNAPLYIMGQWHNGDPKLKPMGGVLYTGGLLIGRKYVSDAIKPAKGWADIDVAFSSGKSEPQLAASEARLAVIRTRFCWFVKEGKNTTYAPRAGYRDGMRGKVQALCGVLGYDFPVVFTFTGKASQEFERGLKDYGQRLDSALTKLGKQFPRFAFYMPLAAGPHVKVGQNGQESLVTPPAVSQQGDLTADYLNSAYVGRDRLAIMQNEWHRAAEWAIAWDKEQPALTDEQLDEVTNAPTDDDPAMIDVSRGPVQTTAQALGFDPGTGPVKRQNQYQAGR